jgi:hypothetical protein
MGAGGAHVSRERRFESLEIGGMAVRNQVVGVPLAELEGAFGGAEAQGNIGNSLLRHFVVYFDYANQRVILEKGDDFQRVFPEAKSGLQTFYNADHLLEVMFILPPAPRLISKRARGRDIVVAIDGVAVEFMDGMMGFAISCARNTSVPCNTVTIERDGARMDLQLTLADLY